MKYQKTGHCLCGKCTYTVKTNKLSAGACHCGMCRRWNGSMVMGLHIDGEVTIENADHLKWYVSSDWGKRGFCGECGTHLFWSMKDDSMIVPMVGTLDNISDISFDSEIFIDHKPGFYDFANDTKKQTEAEVMAQFGG